MTDSVNSIFLATELTPVERTPHGPEEEHAEIFRIPLPEAIEWIESGKIVDAKTVVGLLLAERRLNRRSGAVAVRTPAVVDELVPLEIEEFLSWMVSERGRAANTRGRVPARPHRLRGVVGRARDDAGDRQHGRPRRLRRQPAHRGTCRGVRGAAARGDPDASSPSRQRGRAG